MTLEPRERLQKLILSTEFEKAETLILGLTVEELEEIILDIASNTESMVVYAFMSYLLQRKETSNFHYVSSILMAFPLCHIEGAYEIGLYHAMRAIALDPNDIDLYEYILYFEECPDGEFPEKDLNMIKLKLNELKNEFKENQ